MKPDITVIIPTRAQSGRSELLFAAIQSVIEQSGVRAKPLVVVNGSERNPEVVRSLRNDSRIEVLQLERANLAAALLAGRKMVQTPFFGNLDDDDFLLDGALALRHSYLDERPELDLIVTNGIDRDGGVDLLRVDPSIDVNAAPVQHLLEGNWLTPGSWLCRSDRVSDDAFVGMPDHLECTFLALRFALDFNMLWVNSPTVVRQVGTPHAVTMSREYCEGQAQALENLLKMDLPEPVRTEFCKRVCEAYHAASDLSLKEGDRRRAWRWHLAGLREKGGLKYLPYTGRILLSHLRF